MLFISKYVLLIDLLKNIPEKCVKQYFSEYLNKYRHHTFNYLVILLCINYNIVYFQLGIGFGLRGYIIFSR